MCNKEILFCNLLILLIVLLGENSLFSLKEESYAELREYVIIINIGFYIRR